MDQKTSKENRLTLSNFIFYFLMLSAAGIMVLSYVSMLVSPTKAWFMTFFSLLFLPSLLINIILLIWAVIRRSRLTVVSVIALIPAILLSNRYLHIDGHSIKTDADGLKIVSLNVGKFSENSFGLDQEQCEDTIAAFLNSLDADIICLQEYNVPRDIDLKKYFKTLYPEYDSAYHIFGNIYVCFGNVTLSRLPITSQTRIDFGSINLGLSTDIEHDGDTIRIYNCHFESYGLSPHQMVSDLIHRRKDDVINTRDKVRNTIVKRINQVEQVIDDINGSDIPSIIVGDFNDTPLSNTYHRLASGRKDSFVEAGRGFGASFKPLWPLIRIDYVLYPGSFRAISHTTIKSDYSDHYPVMVELDRRQ